MLVVLVADLGEVALSGPILLHVLNSGISKELGGRGTSAEATGVVHHLHELLHRVGAVLKDAPQRSWSHLLKSQGNGALRNTSSNGLSGHEEGAGACGAVVVDIEDGDLGHSHLVQRPLSAGRVTVAVPNKGLLNNIVRHSGVKQSLGDGLTSHVLK